MPAPPAFFAALVSLAAIATEAPSRDSGSVARAIDTYTRALDARGDLSGQLLVVRDGRVLVERCYGQADIELRVPVTPETRFNIASVTKPMTATVAIQLIEEHRLAIRDSLARWFPGFPAGDSITVGMLLSHRSGIRHELFADSEMTRPITAAEDVERARRLPLDFAPGTRSSYSSGGYEVLARVLELASGRDYAALLRERIFGPLDMTRSGHADSREIVSGRAAAYVPGPHGIENAPLQDFSALVGAGSVWSTARDLRRFVDAVRGKRFGEGPRQSWVRGGRLDFNGRTGGFKAWAVWDSTSGIEAIFLSNLATGAPDQLKRDILDLAAGRPVKPPGLPAPAKAVPSAEELKRWEGVYQIENGPRLELRVRDGALYSNDWVLLPLADGAMFSPRDYGIVRSVAGNNGRIARLEWVQGRDTYAAPRVGD